ncbi:hypothetical protein ACSSS7_003047 [Eimeria intestinalis]
MTACLCFLTSQILLQEVHRFALVRGSVEEQAGLSVEEKPKETMHSRTLESPIVVPSEMDMQLVEGSCRLTLAERIIGLRRGVEVQPALGSKDARMPEFLRPPATMQEAAGGRRTRSVGPSRKHSRSAYALRGVVSVLQRTRSQEPLIERAKPFSVIMAQQAALQLGATMAAASVERQPVWPAAQPTRCSAGSRINCSRETTAEELYPAANWSGPVLPAALRAPHVHGRELQRWNAINSTQQPGLQASAGVADDGLAGAGNTWPLHLALTSEGVLRREASPRLPSLPPFVRSFPVDWSNRLPRSSFSRPLQYHQLIPVDVPSVPVPEALEVRAEVPRPYPFAHIIAAHRSTDSLFVGEPGEVVAHGIGWLPALALQQLNYLSLVEEEPYFRNPLQAGDEEQEHVLLHFSPEHGSDSLSTASCDHPSRLVEGICEELFDGEDNEDYDESDYEDDFYSDSGETLFTECRFEVGRGAPFYCLRRGRLGWLSEVLTPRYQAYYPGFVRAEGYNNHWRRVHDEDPLQRHPYSRVEEPKNYYVECYPGESEQEYGDFPVVPLSLVKQLSYASTFLYRCPNVEHQTLGENPGYSYSSSWHQDFAVEQGSPNNWPQRHEDLLVNRDSSYLERTLEESPAERCPNGWRQIRQDHPVRRFPPNRVQAHEELPFTFPTDLPLDPPMLFDFQRQDCSSAEDDHELWDDEVLEDDLPAVYQTPWVAIESINGLVMCPIPPDDSYDQIPSNTAGDDLLAPMISRQHLVDYLAEQLIPRHSNHDDIEAYAAIRPTKTPEDLVFTGEEATHIIHSVLRSGCLAFYRSREDVEILLDGIIRQYLETSRF